MTSSNSSSILQDVVAYVDVWSSDKRANYSKSFVQQLEGMGAQVSQRFNKQVTHVIFNNGHSATWMNAKKRDVQLVSALWIRRCYDDGVRADEALFPALNDEGNPVMKNRKHRCMLPKDSPERTTGNDWRLKKKLDKMMKDLPPKESLVADMSPIIIDEENGIIYSPALKRSDYMAQRLKDMKDKHENISPTASQITESCELKPSVGSTPTVCKFQYDLSDDDFISSAAELGCSPDKEEENLHLDVGDHDHPKQDSVSPWLSPCHDVPKRPSSWTDCNFDNKEDEEGREASKSRKTSVRKKAAEKVESGESLLQDRPDRSRISPKVKRKSSIKSAKMLRNKSENKKQEIPAEKSFTDSKFHTTPSAVNSSSSVLSAATIIDAGTEVSEKSPLVKKTLLKTPKQARLSISSLVRSMSLSSGHKGVAVDSSDGDQDVFEDYFSAANNKRPLLPNLPVEINVQVPFDLDCVPKKRKQRCSERFCSGNKKTKLENSHRAKTSHHPSDAAGECLQQQEVKTPALSSSTNVALTTREPRRSCLEFTSTSKTMNDAGKCRPASASGRPPQMEDIPEAELQKNSGFTGLSHTEESGGNDCLVAAGFTEILSEAEENQASLTLHEMVKAKTMRTLVMTSMPSEKQHTVVQVVKALGGFSIVDRVCESTTHVVSGGHKRTLNILLGIARGCWILSFEWILWCLEQRQWIPEEPYELSDQFPAAQICRLQRHLSAGEHQQDLFQNQPAMFVSQHSQPPTQSLVELIELCGGTVCKTVRQAGIFIGKYSGRRPEGCMMLSEQWVLDSIIHLKILSFDNYNLE